MATSRRQINPAPSGRDWRFEAIEVFEGLIHDYLCNLHWQNAASKAMSLSVANGSLKVRFINEWPGTEADRHIILIIERQCQVGAKGIVRMGVKIVQSGIEIGKFQDGRWLINEKVPVRVHKAINAINAELDRAFPGIYQG